MSYTDDEELKIGDAEEEDADLDDEALSLEDPLLDDDLIPEDDDDDLTGEGFAGIDGAEY
jgi:hypothetical protein